MARNNKPATARANLNGHGQAQPGQQPAEEVGFANTNGQQTHRDEAVCPRQSAQPYVSLKQRVIQKLRRLASEVGHDHTQHPTIQAHRYSFAAEEMAKQRRRV